MATSEYMRRYRAENLEHVRALDRARYQRDNEKRRRRMDEYAAANPERVAQIKRRWAERNPEKRKAQVALNNAVRDGRIVKGSCVREHEGTCRGRIEAHHYDYSKPLDVKWMCSKHHGEERRLT